MGVNRVSILAAIAVATLAGSAVMAEPLGYAPLRQAGSVFEEVLRDNDMRNAGTLPARLRRQVVNYATREAPGTIVIDTPNTYLFYVLAGGRAIRYGIGVGREGFTWSGVKAIDRKAEWPDWIPPAEMLERQPYLPRFMAGGPGNPLGARAMYLAGTVYRIHGTNAPAHDRPRGVERLHPHAQRGRDRSLHAGECWHQGRRAADAGTRPGPDGGATAAAGRRVIVASRRCRATACDGAGVRWRRVSLFCIAMRSAPALGWPGENTKKSASNER